MDGGHDSWIKACGKRLRTLREEKKMSQATRVAEKIGCSVRQIQRIESGACEPKCG